MWMSWGGGGAENICAFFKWATCLLQTTVSNAIHWTSVLQCSVIRTWSLGTSLTWREDFLTMKFKWGEGFLLSTMNQQFSSRHIPKWRHAMAKKHILHVHNTIQNPIIYLLYMVNKTSYYLHYGAAPSHKEQGSTRTCYNSVNLQDSMFSKSNQSQMPTHYMISLPWSTKNG